MGRLMEKKVDCQSSKLSKYKGFMFVNTTSAQFNSLKNQSYLNFRSKFLFEIDFFNFLVPKPRFKISFFILRLDNDKEGIEANSLKWTETSQEVIRSLAPNKVFNLTITGIGCKEDNMQSTSSIVVKTETFSNGVIAFADTKKINLTIGEYLQFTKYILNDTIRQ
jgi:hypothetical protein